MLKPDASIVLGDGQEKFRQMLIVQHVEDETGHDQREEHGRRVENTAQALPALALGVEKNLPFGRLRVICRAIP